MASLADCLQQDWDHMLATGSYGTALPLFVESLTERAVFGQPLQEAIVENDQLLENGHPMALIAAALLQNLETLKPADENG